MRLWPPVPDALRPGTGIGHGTPGWAGGERRSSPRVCSRARETREAATWGNGRGKRWGTQCSQWLRRRPPHQWGLRCNCKRPVCCCSATGARGSCGAAACVQQRRRRRGEAAGACCPLQPQGVESANQVQPLRSETKWDGIPGSPCWFRLPPPCFRSLW